MSDEETRATEYRRQARERAKAKKRAEKALAGDKAAAAALRDATKALLVVDEHGVRRGDVHR